MVSRLPIHSSPDAPSLSFTRAGGGPDVPTRIDGAAMKRLCVAFALAFSLGFTWIASADSTEVAELASADSTEVVGFASADSTEVAAVILSDDAMPQGPSVTNRLSMIREKIQSALEYPPLARLHDSDGDALVRFEIDRSGSAQNVRVVRSSGHRRLEIGRASCRERV